MSIDTTTIRVPIPIRDIFAAQARDRGVSVTALLTELAQNLEREAIFRSEREATQADRIDTAALEEDADWDTATGEGID